MNIRRTVLAITCLLFCCLGAFAQFTSLYGTTSYDGGSHIIKCFDGNFFLIGARGSSATNKNAFISKLTPDGVIIWTKEYGGSGDEEVYTITKTLDSQYVLVGYTATGTATSTRDGWVFKVDSAGTVLWSKKAGGSSQDEIRNLHQTSDSGYLLAGYSSSYGLGGLDIWVLKIDKTGTSVWNKVKGKGSDDFGIEVKETLDGKYIVAFNSINHTGNFGQYDYGFMRLETNGTTITERIYGAANNDGMRDLLPTHDRGFVILGSGEFGGQCRAYVVKIDSAGTEIASRIYSPASGIYLDIIACCNTADSGFLMAGHINTSNQDAVLIKLDKNLDVVWSRLYSSSNIQFSWCIIEDPATGKIYWTGYSTASNAIGSRDAFLIKTDSVGAYNCRNTTYSVVDYSFTTSNATLSAGALNSASGGTFSNFSVSASNSSITLKNFNHDPDSLPLNIDQGNAYLQICRGDSVQVDATSKATKWQWTSGESTAKIWIDEPDTMYVRVERSYCYNTDSVYVRVRDSLKINPVKDTLLCNGQPYSFLASATGGLTAKYSFQWRDSATNVLQGYGAPFVDTVLASMTYKVIVWDSCSNHRDSTYMTVTLKDEVQVHCPSDTVVCAGEWAQFYARGSGGNSSGYQFNWLNGTSTADTLLKQYQTTTTVKVVLNDGCTVFPDTGTFVVTTRPKIAAALNSDTTICMGESATLRTTVSGGDSTYTYTWDQGLGTGDPKTVSPGSTTTYSVMVGDNCSADNDTVAITVTVRPPLQAYAKPDTTVCQGETFVLYAGGTGGLSSGYLIRWNHGLGNGPTHQVKLNGNRTYQVVLSDGCTVDADTTYTTVTVRDSLELSISDDTLICVGESAVLIASGQGGVSSGYAFTWNNGQGTGASKNVTPDTTTTYRVVLSDNCSEARDTAYVNVNLRAPLTISVRSDSMICRGESIVLYSSATGGNSGQYTFTWDQGLGTIQSPTVSPAHTTTYRLILSDNCTEKEDTAWVTVHVRDSLNVVLNSDTTICLGQYASLRANAFGGLTAGHAFTWNQGLSTDSVQTVNPVTTTQYRIILEDNCTVKDDTAWITVNVRDALSLTERSDTTICIGESVLMHTSVAGGNTPTHHLAWNQGLGSGNGYVVYPTVTTEYRVVLSDNCTVQNDTAFVRVTVRDPLSITERSDTTICIGESVLLYTSSAGGHVPGHQYTWNLGVGTGNYLAVSPSNTTHYEVILRDFCTEDPDTAFVDVFVRAPLQIVPRTDSLICIGENIGIYGIASGGDSTNYHYTWDQGLGTGNLKTVDPDTNTTYRVILSDACTDKEDTAFVNVLVRAPLDITERGDTFICVGESVRLFAAGSGGYTNGYQFHWDNGLDTGNANIVTPPVTDTFQVILKDQCTLANDTAYVTVFVRKPLTLIKRSDTTICKGEEIELYFEGTGGDSLHYTFIWNHDAGTGNYRTVTPDTTTTFHVDLTDNCTFAAGEDSVKIIVRPPLEIEARSDSLICVGEVIVLYSQQSGGYGPTYELTWDQGIGVRDTPTVAPAVTTTYQVVLRDHCTTASDTDHVTVEVRAPLALTPREDTLICVGESVNIGAKGTGGDSTRYIFHWNQGLDTGQGNWVTPATTTTYEVILRDACTEEEDTAELTVWVRDTLSVTPREDSTICIGESILLHARGEGGDSSHYFRWAGTTAIDSPMVSPGTTTTYEVVLYDNCTLEPDTAFMTVFVRPALITEARTDTTICIGESLVLDAESSGGDSTAYEYEWNQGLGIGQQVLVSPVVTTDYMVTLRDNCTSLNDTSWVKVTVRDPLDIVPRNDTFICIGESVDVFGTAGGGNSLTYNYRWDHSLGTAQRVTVSPVVNTRYRVILNDACTVREDTAWMTVYVRQPLVLNVRGDSFICQGETIVLYASATGGDSSAYAFTWNQGLGVQANPVVSPSTGTNYFVRLTDNCTSLDDTGSVNILLPAPLLLSTSNDTLICRNMSVILSASGTGGLPLQHVFTWTGLGTGSTKTVNPVLTTTYSVTLSDNCAFPVADTIRVNVQEKLWPGFEFNPDWACLPNEIDFTDTTTAPADSWYLWEYGDGGRDTGVDQTQVQHSFNSTGVYPVRLFVRTPLGCMDTSYTYDYTVYPDPVAGFLYTYDDASELNLLFENRTTGGLDYHWNYGDLTEDHLVEDPVHEYAEAGSYEVILTAVNQWGCMDTAIDTIEVINLLRVWMPSAFTPGATDTLNRYFGPVGTGLLPYEMWIYDRWGALVYQTKIGQPWDGTYSNGKKPAPPGVYLYVVIGTGEREGKKTLKGTVTLIR